ncbi:MAG: hypothetical protein ACQCN3_02855 [Candidatus Bathyarchaeia archaeon]|jgi:hypothetical protein
MEISKTRKKTVNSDNKFEQAKAASLKNVPIEQRRREANKPLYLTRYE